MKVGLQPPVAPPWLRHCPCGVEPDPLWVGRMTFTRSFLRPEVPIRSIMIGIPSMSTLLTLKKSLFTKFEIILKYHFPRPEFNVDPESVFILALSIIVFRIFAFYHTLVYHRNRTKQLKSHMKNNVTIPRSSLSSLVTFISLCDLTEINKSIHIDLRVSFTLPLTWIRMRLIVGSG